MKKLKVLNLYAGIGGNRKLWEDVEVTAVEYDKATATQYQYQFLNDTVIVTDAHQYLLDHYQEFDFIWASPPCPTHSGVNHFLNAMGVIRYPDMELYQEIIFLKHFYKGKYCIENVKPYYEPLVPAQKCGRHLVWANFIISDRDYGHQIGRMGKVKSHKIKKGEGLEKLGFDISDSKIKNKKKALNNCVPPEMGLHILNCARNIITKQNVNQVDMFND